MMSRYFFLVALGLFCLVAGNSCRSLSPAQRLQWEKIQQEPMGSYWVGRRFHWKGTRVWGYVRRPRQSWDTARLVVIDESYRLAPDRLPESAVDGLAHGYDHNFEYRLEGRLADGRGDLVYDPNGNRELPRFILHDFSLISDSPGFLFEPGDTQNQRQLPRRDS